MPANSPSGMPISKASTAAAKREFDRCGQSLGDHVDHRATVEEAAAEIAVQRAPDEQHEALAARQIEPHVVPQRGDLLGRRALVAQHDLHRIARRRRASWRRRPALVPSSTGIRCRDAPRAGRLICRLSSTRGARQVDHLAVRRRGEAVDAGAWRRRRCPVAARGKPRARRRARSAAPAHRSPAAFARSVSVSAASSNLSTSGIGVARVVAAPAAVDRRHHDVGRIERRIAPRRKEQVVVVALLGIAPDRHDHRRSPTPAPWR